MLTLLGWMGVLSGICLAYGQANILLTIYASLLGLWMLAWIMDHGRAMRAASHRHRRLTSKSQNSNMPLG